MPSARWLLAAGVLLLAVEDGARAAAELTVAAPPHLASAAAEIRRVDLDRLAQDLERIGLTLPPRLTVTLVAEDDARARGVPRWIDGFASGERDIVVFPQRVLAYPYDSLESVFRHEVAHLALTIRSGGEPLPRWFHEGVAMSVDTGWGASARIRLLVEMLRNPGADELARLFAANTEPAAAQAYGLSAALVSDIRRRHGPGTPGAIAARVAGGAPFDVAFEAETGERVDAAAVRAWSAYRLWTRWVPAVTSPSMVWAVILALAFVAYIARARRRALRRRLWETDEEEEGPPQPRAPPPLN